MFLYETYSIPINPKAFALSPKFLYTKAIILRLETLDPTPYSPKAYGPQILSKKCPSLSMSRVRFGKDFCARRMTCPPTPGRRALDM